jgi:hypothetical protein
VTAHSFETRIAHALQLTAAVLALGGAGFAAAQDGPTERPRVVHVDLRAGFVYDSNVAILDLDTSSGQGDVAAQVELGAGYSGRPSQRLSVNASYHLSQTLHQEYDAFDLRIHRGSTGFGYDIGGVNTGLAAHHIVAELDGNRFLVMRQLSPHLSRLVGTRLFLRFAHTYTEKTFRTNPDRHASAHALSADAYVFLNGLTTYLVFGVRHDDEDAAAGHFDYRGNRLRTQLTHRISAGTRDLTLRAQLRTEARRYREAMPSIEPPIDEKRRDRRNQIELTLDLPFGDRLVTRFGYRHADNRSNLSSVDFGANYWSVQLRARL